ncbi:Gfo/Idh/MocA family protein [Micromonospora sp. NPDC051300]|uniref:Gfo/Idh/MocA family protein n=1 Tax=Micromonospora sp. NPDC051300 TaxID=3364286 RepID=UPI0037A8055F
MAAVALIPPLRRSEPRARPPPLGGPVIDTLGVAVVGCGTIARSYARLLPGPELEIRGFTDIDPERAAAMAATFGGRAYRDLDAVLGDDSVDVVVNLTSPSAHYEVIRRCIEAGVHVHTEKPLALDGGSAHELVRLAEESGVRLSCAPANTLGEAAQTMMRIVRGGGLGTVRLVYAEANWGRLETWHPAPAEFYAVGPLADVGVYPLTLATAMFGPARRVYGYGTVLHEHRSGSTGEPFTVRSPDFLVCLIELADGPLLRLTCNFYVPNHSRQRGVEVHGDDGSLYLDDFQAFDATVTTAPFAGTPAEEPLVREPFQGIDWSRGVRQLARSIAAGRPHPTAAAQAAHVVDIIDAARTSIHTGQPVEVTSTFPPPESMPWA